jgi:mRNA-degrading endonuclease RelE of RelBE toxin-antitoxin system
VALTLKITGTPQRYLLSLDAPTRKRIHDKLQAVAEDHLNPRLSLPLQGSSKRSVRVGGYRVLFEIDGDMLIVSDIGPRGQIYRKA